VGLAQTYEKPTHITDGIRPGHRSLPTIAIALAPMAMAASIICLVDGNKNGEPLLARKAQAYFVRTSGMYHER